MDLKAILYGHVVGLRVMRESRLAGTCRTAVAVAMRSSHPLLGGLGMIDSWPPSGSTT